MADHPDLADRPRGVLPDEIPFAATRRNDEICPFQHCLLHLPLVEALGGSSPKLILRHVERMHGVDERDAGHLLKLLGDTPEPEDVEVDHVRCEGLDEPGMHICTALRPDAPLTVREGGIFADGFHAELDRLRAIGSDGQLWLWITNGYPNSQMPAFKDALTDQDRWDVVNYIRTLSPQK